MKPAITSLPTQTMTKGEQAAAHLTLVRPDAPTVPVDIEVDPELRAHDRTERAAEADTDVDDMWDNVCV